MKAHDLVSLALATLSPSIVYSLGYHIPPTTNLDGLVYINSGKRSKASGTFVFPHFDGSDAYPTTVVDTRDFILGYPLMYHTIIKSKISSSKLSTRGKEHTTLLIAPMLEDFLISAANPDYILLLRHEDIDMDVQAQCARDMAYSALSIGENYVLFTL